MHMLIITKARYYTSYRLLYDRSGSRAGETGIAYFTRMFSISSSARGEASEGRRDRRRNSPPGDSCSRRAPSSQSGREVRAAVVFAENWLSGSGGFEEKVGVAVVPGTTGSPSPRKLAPPAELDERGTGGRPGSWDE